MSRPKNILTQDYTYDLPASRIALHPLAERDQSKLLIYRGGKIEHSKFLYLSDFLPENSILFFNNTKVIPARLFFQKDTGAVIEIFLLHPVWPSPIVALAMSTKGKCRWQCTIGNLKRWPDNYELRMTNNELNLSARLINRQDGIVELEWNASLSFSEIVQKFGAIPLPPYIKRKAETEDSNRYQTIYSKENGAVAAPTAGLHFTEKIFSQLKKKGLVIEYLTLHVSAGTFQPVKVENATEHNMHSEQVVITRKNIEHLLSGKKIICVGTTSLRTLESIYWYGVKLTENARAEFVITQSDAYQFHPVETSKALKAILHKMNEEKTDHLLGETSIYIYPGYNFRVIDALITNFHQPGSTLMLLVAALVGNNWKKLYEEALSNNYRFLSYGDSSLLFR
ncbi:MAG: S-adenosylmethionine:tRNA ribosyltransferase-isomerase [Bacteroidetes bacterium]|nr:S-adenosylmethionine:tRNA ribosyltransferase-isomerase [Bacteroidota bacterium]